MARAAGLKFAPAWPVQFRRVRNLPQQAAPFDDDAVNVAGADEVVDPGVFGEWVFVDRGDYLLGSGTVFGRHTVFQIAGNGLLFRTSDGETIASRPAQRFSSPQKRKPASRLARS